MRKRWCDIQRERIENDAPTRGGGDGGRVEVVAGDERVCGCECSCSIPLARRPERRADGPCLAPVSANTRLGFPTHLLRPRTGLVGVLLRQACGGGNTYLSRNTVVPSSRV